MIPSKEPPMSGEREETTHSQRIDKERARLLARVYSYLLARAEELEAAERERQSVAAIAETKEQPS